MRVGILAIAILGLTACANTGTKELRNSAEAQKTILFGAETFSDSQELQQRNWSMTSESKIRSSIP